MENRQFFSTKATQKLLPRPRLLAQAWCPTSPQNTTKRWWEEGRVAETKPHCAQGQAGHVIISAAMTAYGCTGPRGLRDRDVEVRGHRERGQGHTMQLHDP